MDTPNPHHTKISIYPSSKMADRITFNEISGSDPPFEEAYRALFERRSVDRKNEEVMEEVEVPLIDLRSATDGEEIAKAAREWGFFRVINHGISSTLLHNIRVEQKKLFREPFSKKADHVCTKMSPGSYRWGTPSATCISQLSWSEAFHIPLDALSVESLSNPLRELMGELATNVWELAQKVASMLSNSLLCEDESSFFKEHCLPKTCYLRMNRYPICPNYSSQLFGLMPHTDSDFLTILHQDEVGGLQLFKDGSWISVKPHSEALIVNIGDLFQAWSNGAYKSVEHRVVANEKVERLSMAYFFCPSYDQLIPSCGEPRLYREFSFRDYREQVQTDVNNFGHKIGLSRFLHDSNS